MISKIFLEGYPFAHPLVAGLHAANLSKMRIFSS